MKGIISKLHNYYYPAVLFVYSLALTDPEVIRPGIASALFVCLVALEALFRIMKLRGRSEGKNRSISEQEGFFGIQTEDVVMAAWLLFNILSGIWCIAFGMPGRVFLGELFTTAIPMTFYFCGRTEPDSRSFSRLFIISVALTGILGIFLFISAPGFYIDYLMKLELISKADAATMRVRMHSTIGSTLMGFLPSVGMLVSVRVLLDSVPSLFNPEENDRGVGNRKAGILKKSGGDLKTAAAPVLSFLLMLFLAFMSNQRSAMAAALFIIIYLNFLIFFTFRLLPKKYFLIEGLCIMGGAAAFFVIFRGAFMKIYYRLVSLPGSIAQRSDQWVGAANNMKSIWVGNGLGANGHRAIGITEHLIADGGLAKLYVESGIIGTSIFIFLLLLILKKGFKELRYTAPEMGMIITVLLMSIGSNMMSFALSVPVFYYYLGRAVAERPQIKASLQEEAPRTGPAEGRKG